MFEISKKIKKFLTWLFIGGVVFAATDTIVTDNNGDTASSTPPVVVEEPVAIEMVQERTYKSKTFDNQDGTYTVRASGGDIHYKDDNGDFQDSDITPVDMGTYWSMTQNNYHLDVAKDFAAPQLMRYKNKYEGADHTIIYEPFGLAWYNPVTDDVQMLRTQKSVTGVYQPETNSIYYTAAFGPGLDFEITIARSNFRKEVVIPNKPGVFPTPPSANHRLVALFKYQGDGLEVERNSDTAKWDKVNYMDSSYGFKVAQADGKSSFIQPAYGCDADDNCTSLRVMWVKRDNQLWQAKEIPLDKLKNATFPVRFDTITSYTSESNDGSILNRSNSGAATSQTAWDEFHDETTGEALQTGSTQHDCGIGHNGKYYGYRAHLSFDTSAIPDAATITNSSFNVYLSTITDNLGGVDGALTIGPSLGPDNAALSNSYFGDIGTDDGVTTGQAYVTPNLKFADDTDLGSLTAAAYNSIDFNATGLTYISKTGYTKVAMKEGHDTNDTFPNSNSLSRWTWNSSESTNDPYLEITYEVGGRRVMFIR